MPFPKEKTFEELGLDPTREFVFVTHGNDKHSYFGIGDILIFVRQDCPAHPRFRRKSDGVSSGCYLWRLEYADTYKPIKSLTQKLMNIVQFAKNLTLSADEKLLRKLGLKDENGEYTDDYKNISDRLDRERNEVAIIELAKKMDEENKKEK